jgi:hypothetical protein
MMGLLAFLLACGLWPVPLLKGNLNATSVLLLERQAAQPQTKILDTPAGSNEAIDGAGKN